MCGFSKKTSVEKLWREKANMQMSWNSQRAVFAHFRDQRKAGTTRRVTGQSRVASPATYRCKWPKTTEILGLHKSVYFPESDYYTRMRTNDVSIVLQFVCIEFHRHFSVFIFGCCCFCCFLFVLFLSLLLYRLYYIIFRRKSLPVRKIKIKKNK